VVRPGHALLLIVICLLTFGVVMVTSAGLEVGSETPLTLSRLFLGRPALFAALAIALMLLAARFPVESLYRRRGLAGPVPWIVAGSILLLIAVLIPGLGSEVNGARRWIDLGPIGFQPSELAKWGLPLVIAWHATRRAGSMGRFGPGFVAPMVLVGGVCALIAGEDLGTAVLVATVSIALLVAAGAKWWHAGLLVPIGVAGFAAAVIVSPYRINRLRAFLDPYADPQGIGYHVLQSMSAVSGGGMSGRGLGNGLQKFGYLPEDTTDFIFAIIAEELGVMGTVLVVSLYAALLIFGLAIVLRHAHPFSRLLGLGILLTIGLQTLINLLVVTGLAPTKGIALPLISSGGTGWCMTAFCIGLIVSMDRETHATAPHETPAAEPCPPAAALSSAG